MTQNRHTMNKKNITLEINIQQEEDGTGKAIMFIRENGIVQTELSEPQLLAYAKILSNFTGELLDVLSRKNQNYN